MGRMDAEDDRCVKWLWGEGDERWQVGGDSGSASGGKGGRDCVCVCVCVNVRTAHVIVSKLHKKFIYKSPNKSNECGGRSAQRRSQRVLVICAIVLLDNRGTVRLGRLVKDQCDKEASSVTEETDRNGRNGTTRLTSQRNNLLNKEGWCLCRHVAKLRRTWHDDSDRVRSVMLEYTWVHCKL